MQLLVQNNCICFLIDVGKGWFGLWCREGVIQSLNLCFSGSALLGLFTCFSSIPGQTQVPLLSILGISSGQQPVWKGRTGLLCKWASWHGFMMIRHEVEMALPRLEGTMAKWSIWAWLSRARAGRGAGLSSSLFYTEKWGKTWRRIYFLCIGYI